MSGSGVSGLFSVASGPAFSYPDTVFPWCVLVVCGIEGWDAVRGWWCWLFRLFFLVVVLRGDQLCWVGGKFTFSCSDTIRLLGRRDRYSARGVGIRAV